MSPTDDRRRRFTRLANYCCIQNTTYSLANLPPGLLWDFQYNPPTLAVRGEPLALRVVASVLEFGLYIADAGTHFYFELDPIRAVDHTGMLNLYDLASPPPGETSFVSVIPPNSLCQREC